MNLWEVVDVGMQIGGHFLREISPVGHLVPYCTFASWLSREKQHSSATPFHDDAPDLPTIS